MTPTAGHLEGLRPDLLPPDAGWWPLAPGWWGLLLCVAVFLAWRGPRVFAFSARFLWRSYWWLRLRREVRGARARPHGNVAAAVASTLRQAAIARFGQHRAGGLTGAAWLQFLRRTSQGRAPVDRDGALLLSLPYAPAHRSGHDAEVRRLIELAERWMRAC